MLEFEYPKLSDKDWLMPILKNSGCIGADCAFGTIYIWQEAYDIKICRYKDFALKKVGAGETFYGFPIGVGDIKEALNVIIEDAEENNVPFKIMGPTEHIVNTLEKNMPNFFEFKEERDIADYIYKTSDLANLKGKKYHSKRNHISKFQRLYPWKYEEISRENIELCQKFCDRWFKENYSLKDQSIEYEERALKRALEHYYELGFVGGIIKVNDEVVALEIGEEINKDVFLVHFEKALTEFEGSYSLINKEFSSRISSKYIYVNREEDMGIEGLRKAKLSYYPEIILKKYIAIKKD